ncbi:MAG: hypothetical protein QNK24_14075 [Desulfuromusa sp.]|nr:hypothetical protein [Desulfuromusa sp.]
MKYLKMLLLAAFALIAGVLNAGWQVLLFLVDLIDGNDDDGDDFSTDNTIHYNYRTGDIDPVKRLDGLYENKP